MADNTPWWMMDEDEREQQTAVSLPATTGPGQYTVEEIDFSSIKPESYTYDGEQMGFGEAAVRQLGAGIVDVPLGFTSTVDYLGVLLGISDEATGTMTRELVSLQDKILGLPDNFDELLQKESIGQLTVDELEQLDRALPREMRAEFQSEDFTDKLLGFVGASDNVSAEEAWTWFILNSARMAPGAATMMVGGAGIGKLAEKGVQLGMSAAVNQAITARIAAAGTAGLYSGFIEGGSAYRQMIDEGVDPKEAAKKASAVALGSSVLTTSFTGLAMFGLAGKKGLKWTAGRVALAEPPEESSQQAWSNFVTGKPLSEGVADAALLSLAFGFGDIKAGDYTFKAMIKELKSIDAIHEQANLDNEKLRNAGYVTPDAFREKVAEASARITRDVEEQKDYLKHTIDQFTTNPEIELSEDQRQLLEDFITLNLANKLAQEGYFGDKQTFQTEDGQSFTLRSSVNAKTRNALGEINFYARQKLRELEQGGGIPPNLRSTIEQTAIGTTPDAPMSVSMPVTSQEDLGSDAQELTLEADGSITSGPKQQPPITQPSAQANPIAPEELRTVIGGYGWANDKRTTVAATDSEVRADLESRFGKDYERKLVSMLSERGLPNKKGIRAKITSLKRFDEGVKRLQDMASKGRLGTYDLNYMNQEELVDVAKDLGVSGNLRILKEDELLNLPARMAIQNKLGRLAEQGYPQVTIEGMSEKEVLDALEQEKIEKENEAEQKRLEGDAKAKARAETPAYLGGDTEEVSDGKGGVKTVSLSELAGGKQKPAKKATKKTAGAGGRLVVPAGTPASVPASESTANTVNLADLAEEGAPATSQAQPASGGTSLSDLASESEPATQPAPQAEDGSIIQRIPAFIDSKGKVNKGSSTFKQQVSVINNIPKNKTALAVRSANKIMEMATGKPGTVRSLKGARKVLYNNLGYGNISVRVDNEGKFAGYYTIPKQEQETKTSSKKVMGSQQLKKGGSSFEKATQIKGLNDEIVEHRRVKNKAMQAANMSRADWLSAHKNQKTGMKVTWKQMQEYADVLNLTPQVEKIMSAKGNSGGKIAAARKLIANKMYDLRDYMLTQAYTETYGTKPDKTWLANPDIRNLYQDLARNIDPRQIDNMTDEQKHQLLVRLSPGIAHTKNVGQEKSSRTRATLSPAQLDMRLRDTIRGLASREEALPQYDDINTDVNPRSGISMNDIAAAQGLSQQPEEMYLSDEELANTISEPEFLRSVSLEELSQGEQPPLPESPEAGGVSLSDLAQDVPPPVEVEPVKNKTPKQAVQEIREEVENIKRQDPMPDTDLDSLLMQADAISNDIVNVVQGVSSDKKLIKTQNSRAAVLSHINDARRALGNTLRSIEAKMLELESSGNTELASKARHKYNNIVGGVGLLEEWISDLENRVKQDIEVGNEVVTVKRKKADKQAPENQTSTTKEAVGDLADRLQWSSTEDMFNFATSAGVPGIKKTDRKNQLETKISNFIAKYKVATDLLNSPEFTDDAFVAGLYDTDEDVDGDWGFYIKGVNKGNLKEKLREWQNNANKRLKELANKTGASNTTKSVLDYSQPLAIDAAETMAQDLAELVLNTAPSGVDLYVYVGGNRQILGIKTEADVTEGANGLTPLVGDPESAENMTFGNMKAESMHTYRGMNAIFNYGAYVGTPWVNFSHPETGGAQRARMDTYMGIESMRRIVNENWQVIGRLLDEGVDIRSIGQIVNREDNSNPEMRRKWFNYLSNMSAAMGVNQNPINGETLSTVTPEWNTGDGAKINLLGREFSNEAELAIALQMLRNPFIEVASVVMMKDGKVFDVKQATQFSPDSVESPFGMWDADTAAIRNVAEEVESAGDKRGAEEMRAIAYIDGLRKANEYFKANGIDAVYTVHNHPNSVTDPSDADRDMIRFDKEHLGDIWKGEIILDSNEYTFGDGDTFTKNMIPEGTPGSGDLRLDPFDMPLLTPYAEAEAVEELANAAKLRAEGVDPYIRNINDARRVVAGDLYRLNPDSMHQSDIAGLAIAENTTLLFSDERNASTSPDDIAKYAHHLARRQSGIILAGRDASGRINAIHRIDTSSVMNLSRDEISERIKAFRMKTGTAYLSAFVNGSRDGGGWKLTQSLLADGLLDSTTVMDAEGDIETNAFDGYEVSPSYKSPQSYVIKKDRRNFSQKMQGRISRSMPKEVFGEPASGSLKTAPISEEAQRRMQDASHGDPIKLKDSLAAMWRRVNEGFTTEFKGLPRVDKSGKFNFEEARVSLRKIVGSRSAASYHSLKKLTEITKGMTKDQIKDASYYMIFKDLKAQADSNSIAYTDVDGKQVTAFGLTSKEIQDGYKFYENIVNSNPRLAKMIQDRVEMIGNIRSEYAKKWEELGLPVDNKFNDDWFWRRQVIEYSQVSAESEYKGKLMTPSKMDILKRRRGYLKDYVTNYFIAEGELLHSLLMGERTADALLHIRKKYALPVSKQKEMASQARQMGVDFKDYVPEGYTFYQPEKGNMYFLARSITDNQLRDIMNQAANGLAPDLDSLGNDIIGLGGRKQGMVIPTEIALSLYNLDKKQELGPFRAYRRFVSLAKTNMLLNPFRIIKYNLRNITGDADAVFIGNRKLFTSKRGRSNIQKAMKELYNVYYKKGEMSEDLLAYMERGGFDNVLTAQEFESDSALTRELKELGQFMRDDSPDSVPRKVASGIKTGFIEYFKQAQKASDLRETILRYANYLDYKEQMLNNGGVPENFGASDPRRIEGLESIEDRAYRLSDDLMGAYDEVSDYGQWVRRNVAWFWSWQETNARRFSQMLMNDINPNPADQLSFGQLAFRALKSPVAYYGAAKFGTRALAMSAALMLFNHKFFPDEVDDLEEHITDRPFLVAPFRTPDGKVIYFTRIGALSDVLEWFGLDNILSDAKDFMNGKRSASQIMSDNFREGVNKAIQSIRPDAKAFVEYITETSYFPDFFKPRTIRDPKQYVSNILGLQLPFDVGTDLLSKVMPQMVSPRNAETDGTLIKTFAYVKDPLESAYHRVFDMSQKYLKDRGLQRNMLSWNPRTNALYGMKRAIKMGDGDGVRHFLQEYLFHDNDIMAGSIAGLKSSIESMAPLASLSGSQKRELMRAMTPKERSDLDRAEKYYADTLVGSGLIEEILARNADLFAGRAPADDIRLFVQQALSSALVDKGLGKYDDASRRIQAINVMLSKIPSGKREAISNSISLSRAVQTARRKIDRKQKEEIFLRVKDDKVAKFLETMFGL